MPDKDTIEKKNQKKTRYNWKIKVDVCPTNFVDSTVLLWGDTDNQTQADRARNTE